MNDHAAVATWGVLQDLGFKPEVEDHCSDGVVNPLFFDFENMRLSARRLINLTFQEVVSFSGILTTERIAAGVEFDLPIWVESREQCVALIVYYLDQAASSGGFHPTREVGWVTEGRQNRNRLPWIVDSEGYQDRPCCRVQRDWLRLALKTLKETLVEAEDEAAVVFVFDGLVLTIRCLGKVVAMAGGGALAQSVFATSKTATKHAE